MSDNNKLRDGTIDSMFGKNDAYIRQEAAPKRKIPEARVRKRDLEVSVAVLMVDLASSDQSFQPREYQMIAGALKSIFGTSKDEVQGLVNQANLVLKNLRGTSFYAKMLCDNLDEKQKLVLMESIEDLISADGVEDGFEIYHRNRIAASLGIKIVPLGAAGR